MEIEKGKFSKDNGWGADLDHANRPAYPKERVPARPIGVHWSKMDQQPRSVKIFHSTERPGITPVFGSTVPPKGFSGWIRSIGFKFSENDIRHWLLLLFADRVNVVEGVVEDLSRGHIPNVIEEMGLKAEWKYNKKGLAKKAVVVGVAAGASILIYRYMKARKVSSQDKE